MQRKGNVLYRVENITKGEALCLPEEVPAAAGDDLFAHAVTIPVSDLVVARRFGDPIYPSLKLVDAVERGSEKPWNILLQADNYHALQALSYTHAGKVDVIYIDPPYNTGAKDWRYNNDYVDLNDPWRHSKWLSFIDKRLRLARKLLKPDGVLIVTIDEHEVHHLGCLLEQALPDAFRQMVTIVINEKGVAQGRFSRAEEHAMFSFFGNSSIVPQADDLLSLDRREGKRFKTPRWEWLLRGGTNSRREDRKKLFFPIYVDPTIPRIIEIGEPLPWPEKPKESQMGSEKIAWPIRRDHSFGNWRVSPPTLRLLLKKGYLRLGGFDKKRGTWTILYLGKKAQTEIDKGIIKIVARDEQTGSVSVEYAETQQRQIKTVWHRRLHDAGNYGSTLLRTILGEGASFPFPKSLYAVRDTLVALTRNKPKAVILDFFAGSGTTLHAVALMNAVDGGGVGAVSATDPWHLEEGGTVSILWDTRRGAEWLSVLQEAADVENLYIVTKEKSVFKKLTDELKETLPPLTRPEEVMLPMKQGFAENLAYYDLGFLDPGEVARGKQFAAILPLLWMLAGAKAECPKAGRINDWLLAPECSFAVLHKEELFEDFNAELKGHPEIVHVFLVTDSEESFAEMRSGLRKSIQATMLYSSYLRNFSINSRA